MNSHATNLDCTFACSWKDTCQCLRLLVRESVLLGGHLGHAQLAGVRALYYPLELPPCISPDGSLHWDDIEDDCELAPLLWDDDCPSL